MKRNIYVPNVDGRMEKTENTKGLKTVAIASIAINLILIAAYLLMAFNFDYNVQVCEVKNEALGLCIDTLEDLMPTLENYEYYCPEVMEGLDDGTLEFLEFE